MWRLITRALGFGVVVALLALSAVGRSNPAMASVRRGSLVFTYVSGANGSGGFSYGYPAPELYLSAETGAFLGASAIKAWPQESAVALDDGSVSSQFNQYYKACSLQSNIDASVKQHSSFPPGHGYDYATYATVTQDFISHFWGFRNYSWGGTRIFNVNRDGTLGGYQSSVIPLGPSNWPRALGSVDPALSIAYLGVNTTVNPIFQKVERYDLANNVFLSALATEGTLIIRTPVEDHIRVLRDGTILVYWQSPALGSGVVNQVKHYAADGTLLHTIPISTTDRPNQAGRITPDLTDSDTFWITHYE